MKTTTSMAIVLVFALSVFGADKKKKEATAKDNPLVEVTAILGTTLPVFARPLETATGLTRPRIQAAVIKDLSDALKGKDVVVRITVEDIWSNGTKGTYAMTGKPDFDFTETGKNGKTNPPKSWSIFSMDSALAESIKKGDTITVRGEPRFASNNEGIPQEFILFGSQCGLKLYIHRPRFSKE